MVHVLQACCRKHMYIFVALKQILLVGKGVQWLNGRVLDSRPKGCGFEPHPHHCVVVLEQDTFILAKYWFNPGRLIPI